MNVSSGGTASGATVFAGSQVVEAGGIASGTIVSGGRKLLKPVAAR